MPLKRNNLLDAGQEINLKPCSPDNPLPSLIRKQIATAALSVACSRRTARRPAASWFSLALHGYMNVTTQINHYQLCNGKRRNKNAVYGLIQIRFHRGNGDMSIKETKMNDCFGCMHPYPAGHWFYSLQDFTPLLENSLFYVFSFFSRVWQV